MKIKQKTLNDLARKPGGGRTKRRVCGICLEPETFDGDRSSLDGGICRDRDACEQVQPPLIPRAEAAP